MRRRRVRRPHILPFTKRRRTLPARRRPSPRQARPPRLGDKLQRLAGMAPAYLVALDRVLDLVLEKLGAESDSAC